MTTARTLRPTRQRRSQRSLERIVAALEALIEEKTFEEVTVSEVCTRAGVSVGTFYERVGSKDALLEHLRRRFYADILERIAAAFDPARFSGDSLETMIAVHAREMVALHRARRGAIRATIVEARRSTAFAEHARELNRELMTRVTSAWLSKLSNQSAGEFAAAQVRARHAFLLAAGYLREAVVWGELWPVSLGEGPALDDEAIASALASMLLGCLRGAAPPPI